MVPWESSVTKLEREQLTSYIISIQGNKTTNPKAEEGDVVWPN